MYAILLLSLYFLFATKVLCRSYINDVSSNKNTPFWINSCGYAQSNDDDDYDSDASIIYRILNLARQSQNNINSFKTSYIMSTFNTDYLKHYDRWVNANNSWMTPRLLNSAEDDLPESWINSRLFPDELSFTYEILQRVSVGFEKLLEDAGKKDFPENKYQRHFSTCKNNLQQILCEVSDAIITTNQKKPANIRRDAIPKEVRQETSSAKRHLVNSLIFRDFMIAIKYLNNVYESFTTKNNVIIASKQ